MRAQLQAKKDRIASKDERGFTIIEVLIVLVIAGLIMLIVFLAVPALQRNSRNTQRTNDASLIGGAVNECVNNKNGQVGSCDELTELQAVSLDTSKLGVLKTVNVVSGDPTAPTAGQLDRANVGFTAKCNTAGDAVDNNGTARQAVVLYRAEVAGSTDGVVRCVEI